jgi:histidine triad (HIT) family protein
MFTRWLFLLSRKPLAHALVRWGFGHLSGILPVRRIVATELAVAFFHPRPTWSPHILLVPKRAIPSFVALRPDDEVIIADILRLAAEIVATRASPAAPYLLLVNGGAYQDVGQLHFHLTWGPGAMQYVCPGDITGKPLFRNDRVEVLQHPQPARAVHLLIRTMAADPDLGAVIAAAQRVIQDRRLLPSGFTVALNNRRQQTSRWECFHLLSGAAT